LASLEKDSKSRLRASCPRVRPPQLRRQAISGIPFVRSVCGTGRVNGVNAE
jgi:hypothetical protein